MLAQWIESNQWSLLWAELGFAGTGLLALMAGLFLDKKYQAKILSGALLAGGLLILLLFWSQAGPEGSFFSDTLLQDAWSRPMRLFLACCGVLTCFLWRGKARAMEYVYLTYVATAALMLLTQAQHFVLFFVALELASISFIVLIAFEKTSPSSLESGLKYLILAGLSTALMLFGIVLLYGYNTHGDPLSFEGLRMFLEKNADLPLVQAGVLLLLVGLFFKIGFFPFQSWIPDVYSGAPAPTAAFLAVASKAAGFFVLIRLFFAPGPLAPLAPLLLPIISILTILTLLFGSFSALTQKHPNKLMGLSGVVHAGYLMLGFLAAFYQTKALTLLIPYLYAYLLGSFCVFGALQNRKPEATQPLSPFMASVLTLGLASLCGIPPLVGFTTKTLIFIAALQARLYLLVAVAVLAVVFSVYYYLSWVRTQWFSGIAPAIAISDRPLKTLLFLMALASLLLGLVPWMLIEGRS